MAYFFVFLSLAGFRPLSSLAFRDAMWLLHYSQWQMNNGIGIGLEEGWEGERILLHCFSLPIFISPPHPSCDLFLLLAVLLSENSFIGMEREIDDGRVCTFWGFLFGCGS